MTSTFEIEEVANLPSNYTWKANVFVVNTREELLEKVKWCMKTGISLRVKASGWSCNKFLDPNATKSDSNNLLGAQIILAGDFDGVIKVDEHTVTAGAATQREPIYSALDAINSQLMSSGECFTANESQQVGGLIANAVHDTMQESFSPETVKSIEALVFDEKRNPIIRFFNAHDDGDDFFAFFGGMGMTGIIVSATLYHCPKKHYHYRPYLPGSNYDDDDSFQVGKVARSLPELIEKHDIKSQKANSQPGEQLALVNKDGMTQYESSFSNALKDLCLKHKCDKDDVCAMFYLFPSPEEEEEASKCGKLADGSVPVSGLGRYWKRDFDKPPRYTVTQDIYNDISAKMGQEYQQDPRTIDALSPSVIAVQNTVTDAKWRYANLMNHTTTSSTPDEIETALSAQCRHWAFCESEVAHTTGPSYVYLWERASEFYVREDDIDEFVKILQPEVVAMIKAAAAKGTNGSSIFADCRYAFQSRTAFMSGWYKEDRLAIDIGCTKFHFTNEQYTDMTRKVLIGCKEKNIDVRLHTGKFYVYDQDLTHYMYSKDIRGRFGAVVGKHDPYGIFAPQRWRDLFTDNVSAVLNRVPSIPTPWSLPFYYSSLSNFGVYYSIPLERVKPYLSGTGLVPAIIDGEALVSFNFQLYTGHFNASPDDEPDNWPSQGASITQELELCIVSVPKGKENEVSNVSFKQFVLGDEQTKIMGNKRVHVPCDSEMAISAGVALFGEPKFKTTFRVNMASHNPIRKSNSGPYDPEWSSTWGFQINDPKDPSKSICTCISDLSGLNSVPGNFSPITEYGYHENRLIGCRWNILQPMSTYFLPSSGSRHVTLSFGESDHQMKQDMQTLIGDVQPKAVRTFNSSPAAVQSRAFYP